jgi:HK97 gp10 family phage protein
VAYKSRLPEIAAEMVPRLDAATRAAAELVAQRAQDRAPVASGRLRDAIHVERVGLGEYAVVAGNTGVFYGHIVEHGGARTPAHPFLVPAAEESRGEAAAIAAAALRGL